MGKQTDAESRECECSIHALTDNKQQATRKTNLRTKGYGWRKSLMTDVEYQSYTRITPRLHPSILLSVQRAFW